MRIAFDVEQFRESVSQALNAPCGDDRQKQLMAPSIVPTCLSILQQASQGPEPQTQAEAMSKVVALLGTAFALGFDAGRVYEDKEKRQRRVELIQ